MPERREDWTGFARWPPRFAFQVDQWWEQQGERMQEVEYVAGLTNDIENDIPIIQQAIELAKLLIAAVHQAAFTYSPNHTFDDLRSTGNLRLLRDPDIKKALFNYYDFDRDQNQYRPLQFLVNEDRLARARSVLKLLRS